MNANRNTVNQPYDSQGPVRASGMPDPAYWKSFFDPNSLLKEIGFRQCETALELGAGFGLFTEPLAQYCDSLTTVEIDSDLCSQLKSHLRSVKCDNVVLVEGDFMESIPAFADAKYDAVVLFNILHMENPPRLLKRLRSVMNCNGLAFVLHWRTDIETPRGPSLAIRSSPDQCRVWFAECGFTCMRELLPKAAPFHFAQVYSIIREEQ